VIHEFSSARTGLALATGGCLVTGPRGIGMTTEFVIATSAKKPLHTSEFMPSSQETRGCDPIVV
jgi:hypothetical protein